MLARIFAVLSVISVLFVGSNAVSGEGKSVLMVVPARPTLIQLAMDSAELGDVMIVSYDKGLRTASPLWMHVWDAGSAKWVKTDLDEYTDGKGLKKTPDCVVLVGEDQKILGMLRAGSVWTKDIKEVSSMDLVEIVNTMDGLLDFSAGEWKWLSKRYGLKTVDLNKDRRRYGRYGKPGQEKKAPEVSTKTEAAPEVKTETVMPPAMPTASKKTATSTAVTELDVPGASAVDIAPEDK